MLSLPQSHVHGWAGSTNMKKFIAIAMLFASGYVLAHSGGTDSNDCHHERKTGTYHCH